MISEVDQYDEQQDPRVDDIKHVLLVETNELEEKMREHYLDEFLCPIKTRSDGVVTVYKNNHYSRSKDLMIGRLNPTNKNFICISNDMVSRVHCKIYMIEDDLWPVSKEFIRLLYYR